LIDRLERESSKRLVLILGQAAQGKSTLAALFTRHSRITAAWLSLRVSHSDARMLGSSILKAVERCRKKAVKGCLDLFSAPELGPGGRQSLYTEWAQAAFKGASNPIRVVLDGLDRLPPKSTAFELLQVLLEEAPDGVTFLMLSRTTPPLEIERMRLNQQAAVIENHELAFTQRETGSFFSKRMISLSKHLLQEIQQATEGWVGGLILIAEALVGLQAGEKEDFIHRSLPREFRMRSFRYLGEQIFDRQPEEVRDLLIKASLLDVVDSSFLNEFLDRGDADSILGRLLDRNLFVCPVHDGAETIRLRFQGVFRDFLLDRFRTLHPPDAERYWLKRAAGLCERRGDLKNAIHYSIEAADHAGAARLIEGLGLELLQVNRIGELSRRIHSLPPE
jgi:ATP/maltotriose-dependent transcriptional regulator MalT